MKKLARWTLAVALVPGLSVTGLRIAFPLPDIIDRAPGAAIPADSSTGHRERQTGDRRRDGAGMDRRANHR